MTDLLEFPLWYDRDGNPIDSETYSRLCEDLSYRVVNFRTIRRLDVSTVWIGLNMAFGFYRAESPPVIFETMVFRRGEPLYSDRYPSEQSAREGHNRIVRRIATEGKFWEKARRRFIRRLAKNYGIPPSVYRALASFNDKPAPVPSLPVNGREYHRRRKAR